ncbi:MAG: hypothetical protein CFE43_15385 [Burkholderiales bacterium PBB3]|nr:MAG: hypothetical protein CFE43_15385 [Burkholderiales bacterium PBB3]
MKNKLPDTRTSIHTFLALASLLLVSLAGTAHAAACPEVRLSNVQPGRGSVMLSVWGSSDSFFKKPLLAKKLAATEATLVIALCGAEAPEIAVTVYQDLNDNGKLDSNFLGIPSEPTAASGKPPKFKAPDWESTRVPVQAGQAIDIRL